MSFKDGDKMKKYAMCAVLWVGVIIALIAVFTMSAKGWMSGDTYSGSGDWVIDNPTVVAHENIVVQGNLTINNTLKVYNSTIRISTYSDGGYHVIITKNGTLKFYNSYLTSNTSYYYKFMIYGSAHINLSTIEVVWGDSSKWIGGIQIYNDNVTIENSTIQKGMTGGIYIEKCSPKILHNKIIDNGFRSAFSWKAYGIYIEGNGTTSAKIIKNEICKNQYYRYSSGWWNYYYYYGYGIYATNTPKNTMIDGNIIYDNGYILYRHTYGIRKYSYGYQIYLTNSNPHITNNTIKNGRYGIYITSSNNVIIDSNLLIGYPQDMSSFYAIYGYRSTLTVKGNKFFCDSNYTTCLIYHYRSTSSIKGNGVHFEANSTAYSGRPIYVFSSYYSTVASSNNTINGIINHRSGYLYIYHNSHSRLFSKDDTCKVTKGSLTIADSLYNSMVDMIRSKIYINASGYVRIIYTYNYASINLTNGDLKVICKSDARFPCFYAGYQSHVNITKSTINLTLKNMAYYFNIFHAYHKLALNHSSVSIGIDAGTPKVRLFVIEYYLSRINVTNVSISLWEIQRAQTLTYDFAYFYLKGTLYLNNVTHKFITSTDATSASIFHLRSEYKCVMVMNNTHLNMTLSGNNSRMNGYKILSDNAKITSYITNASFNLTLSGRNSSVVFMPKMGEKSEVDIEIEYTTFYISMLKNTTKDSEIFHLSKSGFNIKNSPIYLNIGTSVNTSLSVFLIEKSNPHLRNITMENIPGIHEGIFGVRCLALSEPIMENLIIKNFSLAMSTTFFAEALLKNSLINKCNIGVESVEFGKILIENTSIEKCGIGLYSHSTSDIEITDSKISSSKKDMILDGESKIHSLNTTFDKTSVNFSDDKSELIIIWWASISLQWQNGASVSLAKYIIHSGIGDEILSGYCDINGKITRFKAIECIQRKNYKINYNPYNISVEKGGLNKNATFSVVKSAEHIIKISDDSPPFVQIKSPENNTAQNISEILFEGKASDIGSGLVRTSYRIDDGEWVEIEDITLWSIILNLDEGKHLLQVKAEDAAGNTMSATRVVIIDMTLPYIIIETPKNNSLLNVLEVTINGKVELGASLTINDVPVKVNNGTFTYTLGIVEGKNTFFITAVDIAGNANSTEYVIYMDITPPRIEILKPLNGTYTNEHVIEVIGITEPNLTIFINEINVTADNDGDFIVKVSLISGENILRISGTDAAGNEQIIFLTVFVDDALLLEIETPEDGTITSSYVIVVSGKTDIDAKVTINGGSVIVDNGRFAALVHLREGKNVLIISAKDSVGNVKRVTISIVLDITSPIIEVTSPTENYTRNDEITVSGKVPPETRVYVNDEEVSVSDGKFSKVIKLVEGENIIIVKAEDVAGNVYTVVKVIILDKTPPNLEILEPKEHFKTLEGSVLVIGITEPDAKVKVNGVWIKVDEYGKFSTSVPLKEKKNEILVEAYDDAGNVNNKSVLVIRTSKPSPIEPSGWEWVAGGMLMAIGLGFPLTILLIRAILVDKRRKMG